VFTDRLGWAIGNYTPNVGKAGDGDNNKSVVNDFYSPVLPATSKSAEVSSVEEGSADMIPEVDLPTVVEVVSKLPRQGWWVAMLVTGSSHRSTSQAYKGTSTSLH
jgi:hypothetical protein